MLFYIIPYLFVLLFSFYLFREKTFTSVTMSVVVLLLFPALLVAIARGDVGTDTLNYLTNYQIRYSEGEGGREYEPGFELLSDFFVLLGFTDRMFVNALAIISTLLLSFSFSGLKEKTILLFLVFFPLFFVDFTMNGLRYGLSFSIATLAIDSYYKRRILVFSLLSLVAVSIQYSSFLLILVFLMDRLQTRHLLYLAALTSAIVALLWSYFEMIFLFLTLKQEAYKDLTAPGITSGLAPLVLFLILSIGFVRAAEKDANLKGIYILVFFELVSFVITRFTYAGLRFQTLFLFALIVFIKNNFNLLPKENKYFTVMASVSVLSFVVFLKNITVVVEGDISPFLPYKFFWE